MFKYLDDKYEISKKIGGHDLFGYITLKELEKRNIKLRNNQN